MRDLPRILAGTSTCFLADCFLSYRIVSEDDGTELTQGIPSHIHK